MMKFGTSQAIPRKEDDALLRGAGRYVADIAPPGALAAVVLRSPHAHARFRVVDVETARALPGVRLVLTAADVADLGDLPCVALPPGTENIKVPPYAILARDEVRHVGDAVAFIVADTLEQARDGAEAIVIAWTAEPHVVDAVAALAKGAPAGVAEPSRQCRLPS
jgi:carbon-monoxide dehydrogenase large subunit